MRRSNAVGRVVTTAGLAVGLAVVGCSDTQSSPIAESLGAGRLCAGGAGCGEELSCEVGFCTPTGCEAGTVGCGCTTSGECADHEGAPLSCISNVCVAGSEAAVGTLGGACSASSSCTAGKGLICVDGMCEAIGCPSGSPGCPCGPFGACTPRDGRLARCHEERCVFGDCGQRGGAGCICDSDDSCERGLHCWDGHCAGLLMSLSVGNDGVRACDLLVNGVSIDSLVTFGSRVRGEMIRRPPRLGVSLMAFGDSPIGDTALTIESPLDSADRPALVSANCFDHIGAEVDDAGLVLR